ncbi:MAG TPA: hypothetical protein P5291_12390, partial [Flavobacteriales bacterium]|nr:hypothetical protein [Flavobacteriales bacterium]
MHNLIPNALRHLLLPALFAYTGSFGQDPARFTLSGTVSDSLSGETLIGASVVIKGTTTGA